jgi:aspartate ammonia-lyase
MTALGAAFASKADEFADVVKIGRTQLQDAVPMTLGQELGAFAVMLAEDVARLDEAVGLLHEINLGGTAIGTGITAPRAYAACVRRHLERITGLALQTAPDLVEATQDAGVFVQLSGVLKRVAVKLSKTCNDLRLLSSGPQGGLAELRLPSVQAGSSIMPGKVNPVIPEVVNQIAFEVIGCDTTVTMAAQAGQLQLNAFEPIMFHALYRSITHLRAGCETLRRRCVEGISANRPGLERRVADSLAVVTALNPHIGYEAATAVALEALESGHGVAELVVARGLLSRAQLDGILSPAALTGAGGVL